MEQDQFLQHPQAEPRITPMKWLLYLIVTSIPLIGTVMLFVWAFSDDGRPNRQNWAKGMLLFYVLMLVLTIVIFVIFGAAIMAAGAANSANY